MLTNPKYITQGSLGVLTGPANHKPSCVHGVAGLLAMLQIYVTRDMVGSAVTYHRTTNSVVR